MAILCSLDSMMTLLQSIQSLANVKTLWSGSVTTQKEGPATSSRGPRARYMSFRRRRNPWLGLRIAPFARNDRNSWMSLSALDHEGVVARVHSPGAQEDVIPVDPLPIYLEIEAQMLTAVDLEVDTVRSAKGVEMDHEHLAAVFDGDRVVMFQADGIDVGKGAIGAQAGDEVMLVFRAVSPQVPAV